MIWIALYALLGLTTVGAMTWLTEWYDDFDAGVFRLMTFIAWPLALLLYGLNFVSETIQLAREARKEVQRQRRRELEAAEREVECLLSGRRSRYDV